VPGIALLKARGLYNLALHRFYLDECYRTYVVGTTMRLGKLFDRFDTQIIDRIVGAPVPADRNQSAATTWESYYLAARASRVAGTVPGHSGGMLNWLTRVSASHQGRAEGEVAATGPGMEGRGLAAPASPVFEKDSLSGAAGVIGALTDVGASVSGWVERNVFDFGVTDGVQQGTGVLGKMFNKIEETIARPFVSSIILATAILASLWGAMP
jgi:hypothetical protein